MTGPEHYRKAEEILAFVASRKAPMNGQQKGVELVMAEMAIIDSDLREAQIHATLALAAATAANDPAVEDGGQTVAVSREWAAIIEPTEPSRG